MKYTLFPFQEEAVQDCMAYFLDKKFNKPAIACLPVAAGKSLLTATLAQLLGEPLLIIVPSEELLMQSYDKLIDMGGECSLYSASVGKKDIGRITMATIGSLKGKGKEFKAAGFRHVIVDECHFKVPPAAGSVFSKFIADLKPLKVLGLTASPFLLKTNREGSSLKMLNRIRPGFFKKIIHVTSVKTMLEAKRWSDLKYDIHPFDASALQLNSTGAEYTEESIKLALETNGVNNRVYLTIKELQKNSNNSILVFLDSITTCQRMKEFIPDSEVISAKTPKKERKQMVADFLSGKIKVMLNFGTLTTGFDYPELSHIIMARPTNSLSLYYQIVGRLVRVHENKPFGTFIDFCGNVLKFGRIETLEIENLEGYGWGVFCDGMLRTGVPMAFPAVTKEDVLKAQKEKAKPKVANRSVVIDDDCIWFGKYAGVKIKELEQGYRYWLLHKSDFNWEGTRFEKLKADLQLMEEVDKQRVLS